MQSFDAATIGKLTRDAEAARKLADMAGEAAVNLFIALLILIATVWLSGTMAKVVKKAFTVGKRRRRVDVTLSNFIASLVRYLILIIGLIAVLAQLGVQTTSILAVLGAASLAIGLAMQGTLSNVAAGVMLLMLRPYRVNDVVEIGSKIGTVRSLDLFTTELISPEGFKVYVPNSKVFGDMIINRNAYGKRRIELKFDIDYTDDMGAALAILEKTAKADKRVLDDPSVWARATAVTDHAVTLTLRAWTLSADNGETEPALLRTAKEALLAAGFVTPYPHQIGLTREEFMAIKASGNPKQPPAPEPPRPRSDPSAV